MSFTNSFKIICFSFIICFFSKADMKSPVIELSCGGDFIADENFEASQKINLRCSGSIKGNGTLKSPHIKIKAKNFEFTGIIECTNYCNIVVKEPFNQDIFKQVGGGRFNISTDPNLEIFPESPDSIKKPLIPFQKNNQEFVIDDLTFTIKNEFMLKVFSAIQDNNLEQIKVLFEQNPQQKLITSDLTIAMLFAGFSGKTSIVEVLIDLGAKFNEGSRETSFKSPLLMAVKREKSSFVEALLKKGADPNIKNSEWIPFLTIATLQNDLETVIKLLEAPNIKVDARDSHWRTALMYASNKGYFDIAKALLLAGAYSRTRDIESCTAFDHAIANKQENILSLLRADLIKEEETKEENTTFIKKTLDKCKKLFGRI